MVKAKVPLTPRHVLGNRRQVDALSLKEASAALVAMLSGEQSIASRGALRKIAAAVDRRRRRTAPVSRQQMGGRHHG
jgi:hypothetical protein